MPPRKRSAPVAAGADASLKSQTTAAAASSESDNAAAVESDDTSTVVEPSKKKLKQNAPTIVEESQESETADDVEMTDAKPEAESEGNATGASPTNSSASVAALAAFDSPDEAVDFTGRKFLVMGGFSRDKRAIESMIIEAGGTISKTCNKSIAYCVCGRPVDTGYGGVSGPGSKVYREAKKAKVPILNEVEFLALLEKHKKTKEQQVKDIEAGLIPDLSAIVGEYVNDEPGIVEEGSLGACWLEICDMIGCVPEKPCSQVEIQKAESEIRRKLPSYLRSLYTAANGADSSTHCCFSSSSLHPSKLFPCLRLLVDTHTGRNSVCDQSIFKEMGVLALWKADRDCVTMIDLSKGLDMNTMVTIDFDDDPHSLSGFASSMEDRIRLYHLLVKKKFDAFQRRFEKEGNGKTELEFMRMIDQETQTNAQNDAATASSTVAAAAYSSTPIEVDSDPSFESKHAADELRAFRARHFCLKDELDTVAETLEKFDKAEAEKKAASEPAPSRFLTHIEVEQMIDAGHVFLRGAYYGSHKPDIPQFKATLEWTTVKETDLNSVELEGVFTLHGANGGAVKVRGTGEWNAGDVVKMGRREKHQGEGNFSVESYELICGSLFVPCVYEGTLKTSSDDLLRSVELKAEYYGVGPDKKAAKKVSGKLYDVKYTFNSWYPGKLNVWRTNDLEAMAIAVKKAHDEFDGLAAVSSQGKKKAMKKSEADSEAETATAAASSSSSSSHVTVNAESAAEAEFMVQLRKLKGGAVYKIPYWQQNRLKKIMRKYERSMYD